MLRSCFERWRGDGGYGGGKGGLGGFLGAEEFVGEESRDGSGEKFSHSV